MPHTLKSVLKRTLQLMKDERIVGFSPNNSLTTIPASYFDSLLCDLDATDDDPNEGVMEERKRIVNKLSSLKTPNAGTFCDGYNIGIDDAIKAVQNINE